MEKLTADFDGTIPLENRYHFTNLKNIRFRWQLVNFSLPQQRECGHVVLEQGETFGPDIAPVQKANLKLNLPNSFNQYDAFYLRAFDRNDNEIYCWSWKIDGNIKTVSNLVKKSMSEKEKTRLKELKKRGTEADNILPIEQQAGNDEINTEVNVTENDSVLTMKASGIAVSFSKNRWYHPKGSERFWLAAPVLERSCFSKR